MSKTIEATIIEIFKNNLELDEMNSDTLVEAPLSTMNMNSITFIKIIVDIEQEYDFEVEPENLDIAVFKNIKSISSFIESRLTEEKIN